MLITTRVTRYVIALLIVVLALTLIVGWLIVTDESAPLTNQPLPVKTPVLTDTRSNNAAVSAITTTMPPVASVPTATPTFMPTSTLRPTRVVSKAFVRCDNPNVWSLPVNDSQFLLTAQYGIQPIGSNYYNGMISLKLITPIPTPTPSRTPESTPATISISSTPSISSTVTITPGVFHPGVDLHTGADAPIYAVSDGTISQVSYSDVYGVHVILQVKGYQVLYGHLNEVLVEEGQAVECGHLIGLSGATGIYQTGPHLHFEVRQKGEAIDPLPLLQRAARAKLSPALKAQMQAVAPQGHQP